jgi:phosphate-selective porin OprO and OprP
MIQILFYMRLFVYINRGRLSKNHLVNPCRGESFTTYLCALFMQNSNCLKKLFPGFILFFMAHLLCSNVNAQVESDERPLAISPDGISFHRDSIFHMNLRFRMQNRFGYLSTLDGVEEAGFEAMVRRLRLRLDGYVLNRKIGYYIQLSFSRSDQDLASGTIAQTVRDAMVYYNFNKNFYMGFGQSKLPATGSG